MRTTLNIDYAALAADPGRTKTAVINDALRDYARRRAHPPRPSPGPMAYH